MAYDYEKAAMQQIEANNAPPPGAQYIPGYDWDNDPKPLWQRQTWYYADLRDDAAEYWKKRELEWQPAPDRRNGRWGRLCGPAECQAIMRWCVWARQRLGFRAGMMAVGTLL